MIRESSPPEAAFVTGSRSDPGLAEKRISTRSRPRGPSGPSPTAIARRALGMARVTSSAVAAASSRAAAAVRSAVSSSAAVA